MSPSLCTIYKCQGETSRASFKWTHHQQTVSTDTPGVDPPTPGRLNFIFLSHSGIKRNQMKVAGSFFSPIIYHSASESNKKQKWKKKKSEKMFVWEGSKPRTLVVSENMFSCLLTCQDTFYLTCALLSTHLLARSPFFPIFTSKKKSILNSMSQSILSISIQPQRDKQKSNSLDP